MWAARGKKQQNEFIFDCSTSENVFTLNAIYKRNSSVVHWRCIENSLRLEIDWSQTNAIIWRFRLFRTNCCVASRPNDFKCRSPLGNQADFHERNWISSIRPWKLVKNYFYIFFFWWPNALIGDCYSNWDCVRWSNMLLWCSIECPRARAELHNILWMRKFNLVFFIIILMSLILYLRYGNGGYFQRKVAEICCCHCRTARHGAKS